MKPINQSGMSKEELEEQRTKAIRYDVLEDVYLNQNEKHMGELLSNYFEDYPIRHVTKRSQTS